MRFLKRDRLTHSQKKEFCLILAGLLANGFTLNQAITFIQQTNLFPQLILEKTQQTLAQGRTLAECFALIGYSNDQILQIELTETHGNLLKTLAGIAEQMKLSDRQRENFIKTGSYPILLLIFLVVILSGMRLFLLPQLLDSQIVEADSWSIKILQAAPWIVGTGVVMFSLLFIAWIYYLKKLSPILRNSILCKIPLFGRLYQMYYSAYFSLEWGKLFDHGLELVQIIDCLEQNQTDSLMGALAKVMKAELGSGNPLAEQLSGYPFLTKEFSQIVRQGEAKGNLGQELLMYSDLINHRFFQKLEKLAALIQPLVFLLVGLLIIGIYLAMLLPIYGQIEGGI